MISELITLLDAAGTDFNTIAHALSTEPVDNLEAGAPANYLYEGSSIGSDGYEDSECVHLENRTVISLIVCKWTELETLQAQSRAVIRGYQDNANTTPLLLVSSETIKIKGEYIWRKEIFATMDYS